MQGQRLPVAPPLRPKRPSSWGSANRHPAPAPALPHQTKHAPLRPKRPNSWGLPVARPSSTSPNPSKPDQTRTAEAKAVQQLGAQLSLRRVAAANHDELGGVHNRDALALHSVLAAGGCNAVRRAEQLASSSRRTEARNPGQQQASDTDARRAPARAAHVWDVPAARTRIQHCAAPTTMRL